MTKKKLLALTLSASMVLSLAACGDKKTNEDQTPGSTNESQSQDVQTPSTGNQLTIGDTTELQGDWSPYWSNGAADYKVWNFITGATTVEMDATGVYYWNGTVLEKDPEITVNDDGSKTVTYTIKDGLVFNNGEEITAQDYVAATLLFSSNLLVQDGATSTTYGYYFTGWKEFNSGETDKFAGVHLIDDNTFSVEVAAEYQPYYYDKAQVAIHPEDIEFWLGEGVEIKDDGEGAYISIPESLTSDDVKANLETARFATDRVTAGPYNIKSYDEASKTATLTINDKYAGNYEGQKPSIETLVYKKVETQTCLDELRTGQVDLLSAMSSGDEINAGLDLVEQGGFKFNSYERNGYGQLVFACDFGPTQFVKVRQALAHLLDRNEFCKTFTGGYGSVVSGYFGTGMWQYQELADELDSELNTYSYSLEDAVKLLEEDGWVYDANGNDYTEGIRYKKLDDGSLMALELEWLSSEANPVSELLVTELQNNPDVAKAGIKINQTVVTFSELLNYYYRASDDAKYTVPTYHMFNMATGFTPVFDPSTVFTTDPEMLAQGYNNNYIVDEELDNLAKAIALTDPTDKEGYLANFLAFEKKWNELLPNLPLYSNEYHDFFNEKLQNYNANDMWDVTSAILYATIEE